MYVGLEIQVSCWIWFVGSGGDAGTKNQTEP